MSALGKLGRKSQLFQQEQNIGGAAFPNSLLAGRLCLCDQYRHFGVLTQGDCRSQTRRAAS